MLQNTELAPEREAFQLQGGSRFEGRQRGGREAMKRAERQKEDLTENAQTASTMPRLTTDNTMARSFWSASTRTILKNNRSSLQECCRQYRRI